MKILSAEIINFLDSQSFVLVSTIDKNGFPHNSCKGIVKIDPLGQIYLLDVYHGLTSENIKHNHQISISAVDEHKFVGYCLKGKARVVLNDFLSQEIIKSWEDRITSRLSKRLLRNMREEKGPKHHPEASLPKPKYLIVVEVEEIVDLVPINLRKEG
jgi:general stress protein 26